MLTKSNNTNKIISNGSKSKRVGSREVNFSSQHHENVASTTEMEQEEQMTEKNMHLTGNHQSYYNNDDDDENDDASVNESTTGEEVEHSVISPEPLSSLSSVGRSAATHRFWWLRHYHLNELTSAAVAEFIGTFLFVLTVPLSSIQHAEMAPISIGFTLLSLVFTFGYLSGGHMNPVVSLSIWLCTSTSSDKYASFGKRRLVTYVIAQMLGGTAATLLCMLINGRAFPVPNMGLDFIHMLRGFFAESAYTFLLCTVVLHVAVSKQRNSNFGAFSIGFTIVCGGLTCGSISGGVFNPVIATPLIVLRCLFSFDNAGCTPMASLWVYWASEMLGAILASVMYLALQNVNEEIHELEESMKDEIKELPCVYFETKISSLASV